MKEFYDLVAPDEAWQRLEQHLLTLPGETVDVEEAWGRVLGRNLQAPYHLPGFARSTVDGYAVRARDTFGASESLPALIRATGIIRMGEHVTTALPTGAAMAVPTGGMLPEGADAVVMVEHVSALDVDTIEVYRAVAPLENTVQADEDARAGDEILPAGRLIRAQDQGVLAAAGITSVPVVRAPRVGIISTGDEVVSPAEPITPGKIRDVNSYTIAGMVRAARGIPVSGGICPDELEEIRNRVRELLSQVDMLIISGGSSVGVRDHALTVINELGEPGVLLHGVMLRPGRPVIIGAAGNKPVFGLPGHPVSTMVTFFRFVRPAILQMAGREDSLLSVPARISRNLASSAGREEYIRVRLLKENGQWVADPVLGKSGMITTMTRADGMICIPLGKEGVLEGEPVDVFPFADWT